MSALEKFEKFNQRVSRWFERIGIFAFLLMMCITCVDVVGAKLFKMPVFGALDVFMIAQLVAISFAAALTLICNRHIKVEFVVLLLPRRLQVIMDCIVHFLGFALFLLIVWRLFLYGYDFQIEGEESPTAHILLFPFVYGAAIASVPVCLVFLHRFIDSIIKAVNK